MKTLRNPDDRREILERLRRIRSDMPPRWGRMTAPQMVCHLSDAFRNVLGERQTAAGPRPGLLQRTLFKWLFLYALPSPRGVRTRPESDQEAGGTRPTDFTSDVAGLEETFNRFVSPHTPGTLRPHFMFGAMTDDEWWRWGYLHMDHHLRQFGL